MATYTVRYYGFLPEDLTGNTVECLLEDGSVVARQAKEGDTILGLLRSDPRRGYLYINTGSASNSFTLAPVDLTVGDVIVAICPQSDLPQQAGNMTVVSLDGSIMPVQSHGVGLSVQQLSSSSSPQPITASVVLGDTTEGDVVGALPDAITPQAILVKNVSGAGSLQINPQDGQTVDGQATLILGPSDRATLVATGAAWEVW